MDNFEASNAPSSSDRTQGMLREIEDAHGFVDNLTQTLSRSPTALAGYMDLERRFAHSSFSLEERMVIALTVSVENQCHYCVPFHTRQAHRSGLSPDLVQALRNNQKLNVPRLEALRSFTQSIVSEKGWVSDKCLNDFYSCGFSTSHVIDVVLGVAYKTFSNYINHIADTTLDDELKSEAWTPPLPS